ncbi:MAG: hypothetical protein E7410_02130 [Ruminococcaceae bacterium]|nr:hypothetical protein [Oscillospiraceae bacterium]
MKKYFAIFVLFCIVAGLFYSCSGDVIHKQERYFGKINSIIKDLDFHSAEAKDGKIILYNNEYEPISEIPFEEYDESIKFIGAHKDGPVVYFATSGMVDNENGIMFINDEANELLREATKLVRIAIGGNSYEYSTVYQYREAN